MSGYDNRNKGALFRNDKEGGNPDWPDFRGSVNVEGKDYWLSGWKKTSKAGASYLSLAVKPKETKKVGERTVDPQLSTFGDDEIPF